MPYPPPYHPLGQPFIELPSVDSTNNYALHLIHDGLAEPGTAIFAHEQTAGKGQRGRQWETGKSENLAISVLFQPLISMHQQFSLSACTAVASHQLLQELTSLPVRIKWPNDLYIGDRKVGGILIENVIRTQSGQGVWAWAVVGIGINVNQQEFPHALPNPVSLYQVTGKPHNPIQLASRLCQYLNDWYLRLLSEGYTAIEKYYHLNLYKKNEKVRFRKESRIFEATVKSVNPAGDLVVEHGLTEELRFGDVEWQLK